MARRCKSCGAPLGRLDHREDAPAPEPPVATRRGAPALAGALAAIAAVLWIVVAVQHRTSTAPPPPVAGPGTGSGGRGDAVDPRPPVPSALVNAKVAAMFGAICRHEITCGIGVGFESSCDYIEDTMKQMPAALGVGSCAGFDATEATRCLAEISTRSCDDFAKALDVLSLQQALDRITSCRRVCR